MFFHLKSQVWTRQQQIQTWIGMSRKSPPPQKKLTNCTSLFLSLNKSLRNKQHLNSTSPFFYLKTTNKKGAGRFSPPHFQNDKIWVRHAGDRRAHLRLDSGGLRHREGTAAVGAADGTTGRISGWLGGIGCSFWVCWCCVCFLLGNRVGGKIRMLMMKMQIDKDQNFWRWRVLWFWPCFWSVYKYLHKIWVILVTSRGVGLLNFSTTAGGIFPSLTWVEFAKFSVLEQLVAIRTIHFFVWASYIHLCSGTVVFFWHVATVLMVGGSRTSFGYRECGLASAIAWWYLGFF